jgi:hypothetical protein
VVVAPQEHVTDLVCQRVRSKYVCRKTLSKCYRLHSVGKQPHIQAFRRERYGHAKDGGAERFRRFREQIQRDVNPGATRCFDLFPLARRLGVLEEHGFLRLEITTKPGNSYPCVSENSASQGQNAFLPVPIEFRSVIGCYPKVCAIMRSEQESGEEQRTHIDFLFRQLRNEANSANSRRV